MPANSLATIVQSIMRVIETGIEDGKEATSFDSTYVDVTCIVTSNTGKTSLVAGEPPIPTTTQVFAAIFSGCNTSMQPPNVGKRLTV